MARAHSIGHTGGWTMRERPADRVWAGGLRITWPFRAPAVRRDQSPLVAGPPCRRGHRRGPARFARPWARPVIPAGSPAAAFVCPGRRQPTERRAVTSLGSLVRILVVMLDTRTLEDPPRQRAHSDKRLTGRRVHSPTAG